MGATDPGREGPFGRWDNNSRLAEDATVDEPVT